MKDINSTQSNLRQRTAVFTPVSVNPVYKLTPILEPKNKFFLFLGKNFLENLSFILEFSFRYTMVTQKICPEHFLSQFVTHV